MLVKNNLFNLYCKNKKNTVVKIQDSNDNAGNIDLDSIINANDIEVINSSFKQVLQEKPEIISKMIEYLSNEGLSKDIIEDIMNGKKIDKNKLKALLLQLFKDPQLKEFFLNVMEKYKNNTK